MHIAISQLLYGNRQIALWRNTHKPNTEHGDTKHMVQKLFWALA